ncbi:hypothetical protein RB195_003334 [Necator americanus]|uniref:HECT-type E3 ubiquitin transferase n=1 Tax=Necator americanus TaxID=51031 RepID=A0ABR1DN33_NECAM
MKIDYQNFSACNGELPPLCANLIETIKSATTVERFIEELNRARDLQAVLGKTELSRWADVLNRCDEILEDATVIQNHEMKVDKCPITKYNTISILRFTGLLFDCTSTRRIYASTDRIIRLTECTDMDLVSEVLRLLQTISKRSKFLTQRLCPEDQASLVMSLTAMAQCWGGKLRNLKMEDCVRSDVKLPPLFPFTFTDSKAKNSIVFERRMVNQPLLKVVDEFATGMTPEDRYSLLARIRMLRNFELREHRMQCLIVRLLSISTLIYCKCQPDEVQISALLYSGFIEEAVALLKVDLNSHELIDPIQTEALRMLCSVVSLEKVSRTSQILDVLSAGSYHGFLAVFTRSIVEDMKRNLLNTPGKPSVALSTALLSFIYHLSNADPGGETLAACGLTQTLLSVISHHALPLDQATLATRCTRITDNFTTIDVTGFNNCRGMDICIDRLIYEVDECRKEQPFVIDTSGDVDDDTVGSVFVRAPPVGKTCHPQRSGLIKALITFIKRAIQDSQFQDSVRHIMEGQLPDALMHIISNSEYYSASLYHHAIQLVVNFIYQEPSQLTILQNRHVPYVILQSMLRKELPNSRDVISHMGNVFTALCLNEKGLKQFKAYAPFDHLFNIVLSIKFIVTMKKKRSEMNDAAQGIGSSLDDLLRHQPTLKPLMLDSVLGMLNRLVELGSNPPPNTKIVMALSRSASKAASQSFGSGSNTPNVEQLPMSPPEIEEMSDDDEEAEMSMDELSGVGQCVADKMGLEMDCPSDAKDGSRLLPLGDYLLIFTKIFEAIITQVAAADLVEGFVEKNGVEKILSLCNLPSLAADLAASTFSSSVGSIVKFVLQHVKSGDKLMLAIMEVFLQSIGPLVARTSREFCDSNTGGASLLVPLGDEGIVAAITSMSNAVPILSMLTKNNALSVPPTQGDLRNRVWDAWLTDTGKRLHIGFRKVARVLAWETALLKMIEPTKTVATTQTDPSEIEALCVGTSSPLTSNSSEPNNVMSVAVDPPATAARQPAWALAGITQAENAFWHRHKNVADMVIKANKTVSEFLSQLSRSCFVPTRRNRRYDFSASTMSKSAQQMADEIFAGFFRDLKWSCHKLSERSSTPPMEFGRLQEVIVQMSVALFDDRRQPFHAMLQRFYTSGCHNAFCDLMIEKLAPALSNEYNDWLELAFLEWFRLASRLANKQNMIHTMYRQPQPLTIEFDPKKYLKLVHNDFFRAFCVLFSKLSDEKVDLKCCQTLCETAISVYKDVAHSLTPASEETQRPQNDETVDSRAQAADGEESQRDAVLRQLLPEGSVSLLVDMGFPHELVVQALEETGSTEGATEWLINRNAAGLQQALERSNDVGDLEEGEFVDANLPFLLGVAGSSSGGTNEDRDSGKKAGTSAALDAEDSIEMPIITPLKELNIDTDLSISRACVELMPLCKRLMELGSDLVFSCADLVSGMVNTLEEEWRRRQLIGQIMIEEIIAMARSVMSGPSEHAVRVLATRIHFACLLFDHVADEYLEAIGTQPMVSTMLLLLGFVYDNFDVDYMQNGLLSPVVLWLDLYDKGMRAIKRRNILKAASPQLKWSYHAEEERISAGRSHKKWQPYSPVNQLQLNKAFFSGKTNCVLKIPRKEKDFTVDFSLMKQTDGLACNQAVFAELPDGAEIDIETLKKSERESVWTTAETSRLLVIVVSLLHKSLIHHTAAHTILAFVARLTRDPSCAVNFIQQGGITAVLQLRCSTTPSTSVLTSLIIRQCIDDENMMTQVMEKSVRVVTNPVQSTPLSEYLGMSENKPKDWCETLNKLAPLSTRCPAIFVNTMEKSAKLDGTLMVSTSAKPHFSPPSSNERTQQIVQLLLRECIHGEWPSESSVPLGHTRMISRGAILSLLAELVKSYPGVATLICEAKEDGQSVIHQLIEHFIDGTQEKDTLGSLKTLISILAACNHSPKAQESLVSDMKASLLSVGSSSLTSTAICSKVSELCSLLVMMLDSCPSSSASLSHSHHRHLLGGAPSPITKLFHKKRICNDLVKTITYLQLSQKEAIDTVNTVLKTLETLMRSTNSSGASANSASITHGARNVARAQAVINAAVADAVRIPSPSSGQDTGLAGTIDLSEILANNLLNDSNEMGEDQDDRSVQAYVRVSENSGHRDDQPRENDHHRGEVMDEEMDEEAVEDSMSSGEEDNEDRTVEDEEGDDREEDDTMDGEDQDEEEEEDDEDGRREGEVQATVRVDAEESGEDGEEEEEDDDEEMYDYPDEDEDTLHDLSFELLDRPGLSSFGFDDFIFGPPIGINREHRGARREQSSAGVHPLMVRPAHIADSQPSHNLQSAPTVGRLERIARLGNYRSLLLDSGGARIPVTLTRQNAIRRIGGTDRGYVGPTSQLFDRLFDLHARDRSGPLMNVNGRIVNVSSNLLDSPEERRMRQPASAPSALDRFTDGADMMDGVSMQYVAIIINTIVTRVARKRVDEEKAKEAAEEAAKKVTEDGAKPTSSENAPSTSEETGTSNATATVLAHPPTEVARQAWDESVQSSREPDVTTALLSAAGDTVNDGDIPSLPVVDGEAMDTSEAFEPRDVEADVSMDEAPPHSSAATVASSLPEAEGDEERMITPPLSTAQNPSRDGEEREASDRSDNSGHTETTTDEPSADGAVSSTVPQDSNNTIPEEFRDILGDIEIPDGVDPAFLAALPEDMRAEVIRDHRRQQRAQRAAQPPTVAVAQDGNSEGGPSAVPAVEPIDQDFLAALPPELQEEILAQHERAVREAEEALRRANAPAPPVPPEPEMDGAAVIASLPAHERTQVLAEMDESELQRLPADMQDEARRARASLEPNILRFRHLLMPSSRSRGLRSNVNLTGFGTSYGGLGTSGSGTGTSGAPAVGSLAGQANTANTQSLQLLDRDSILILTMLFLVDNRLSNGRLQKVIRLACSHANTCDFVIWCLLALLEKAHDGTVDEEELVSVCPSWLDSITVSGVGHNERALKIGKHVSKVAIHPLLSLPLSKNVLDTLATIAKTYPGHFLPSSLRKAQQTQTKDNNSDASTVRDASPPMDLFWELVQASSCKSLTAKEARESGERMSLETSHVGRLMKHLSKPVVAKTGTIQDRLLRVISTVVQTLPNETMTLLGDLEGPHPLESQLKAVIDVLMRGSCSNEGLADGRTLLVECMRALPPSITDAIYEQLFTAVENVGLELQPQIDRLIEELGEPETPSPLSDEVPSTSKAPSFNVDNENSTAISTTNTTIDRDRRLTRTRIGRLVLDAENTSRFTLSASSCPELQLPAVTMLTDKSGAQYKLLSALQTLSKIRDTIRQMKEERRKKEELEKKKKEEESKATEATSNSTNEQRTIDPVAVDDSSTSAEPHTSESVDLPAAPTSPGTSILNANQEMPKKITQEENNEDVVLSHRLTRLDGLWDSVSTCLLRLGKASDHHAVLALQPAAEAFFLVHAVPRPANSTVDHHDDPDTLKMIAFAEKHREVLNQVLRQNNTALSPGGPFAALIQFPKLLDFDVKRKYFRKELGKMDGDRGFRRADVQVQVRRSQIFSDSFRELYRLRPNEWKHRFYIIFQGEEGQDAGGLLREWFSVITREIFNPNYALFITAPGDMVTYMINKASYINPEHLDYFKFVGRLIAKAIYDNKLLDCYFTRAFYKHILNLPVRYQDIESEDPAFYNSLEFLLNNPIDDLGLDLSFSLEVEEFGVRSIRDLKPDGRKIDVTDANKEEYVKLVCQMKMTGSIRKQLDAFLTGFYEVIPKQLISMFNEQELELLISGLPDVDIDDLANNTEYKMYTKTSAQIQWFWRALRSFEPEDRAKFLQFVTGTSKVPLQGFASLEGMNGIQKFSIHMDCRGGDRLPAAHTCFNQLDLPQYESYEKLRDSLLMAIRECTEGFGFA